MKNVLEILKKANCKNFSFEEYDDNVAIVRDLNGIYVFVEYIEKDDCFVVFDGGFCITECLENFGDGDKIVEKVKKVLTKYQVNKNQESLYLESDYENLEEAIERLINVQNEILYK